MNGEPVPPPAAATGPSAKILTVIANDRVFRLFEPLMGRSDVSLARVRSGKHALTLAHDLSYNLIVCQHPLSDLGFGEFHSLLRSADCASRQARLVAVTRESRRMELMESLEDEDARVVCLDGDPVRLQKTLNELVGGAIRAHTRLLVEARISCGRETASRVFQTSDISESGFLLRTARLLPVGSRSKFALKLPDSEEPVCGLAEVVRHTRPDTEMTQGMAMRLLRVEGDGRERLAQFIRRRIRDSSA